MVNVAGQTGWVAWTNSVDAAVAANAAGVASTPALIAAATTAAAGGDLSGMYPNPTVTKINGVTVAGPPIAGQVPTATSATTAAWTTPSSLGPVVQATKSAAQSTAAAAGGSVAVLFDTEAFDTDGMHSTVTNTSRLTATLAGYYRINGKIAVAVTGLGYTTAQIAKNGAGIPQAVESGGPSTGAYTRISSTATVALNIGDYVEVMVACSATASPISIGDCMFEANFIRTL